MRLEATLATYRGAVEAASAFAWLAPMLPRLLGGPPSPALWRALFTSLATEWGELRPGEDTMVFLLFARGAAWIDDPPTLAEVWDDRERLYAWDRSAPPDGRPPMSAEDYAQTMATRPELAAWWDACPFPRLMTWYQTPDAPAPDLSWVEALLDLWGDGDGWTMAEVLDGRGVVVERYPWPAVDYPAEKRLEAARLAETALEALGDLETAKRPHTLEEVREWLQTLRES